MVARLAGKVAVVTGASGGIGRGIAGALARESARVVLASLPADAVVRAELELLTAGGVACGVPTDVADEAQVDELFKRTLERFDRVDLLFNCASVADESPLAELSAATWDSAIAGNLRGSFLCTRAAFGVMQAQGGGQIINVVGLPAHPSAAAIISRQAIEGLTEATSAEGHPHGIACSALFPNSTVADVAAGSQGTALGSEGIVAHAIHLAAQLADIDTLQPHPARG
jgi:NAD(P)-dependent dehydrogenase (short-subunit alcohol dehydrogenase family)